MTAPRLSVGARIRLQNRAEVAVNQFSNDHALWHKHVHGVDLDPMQIFKCLEMDQHPNTIDFSCRRSGKTAIKELYLLKHQATHPDQEEGIVAPKEGQSLNNLSYHLDAIRRSEILTNWIGYERGRATIADTYYKFGNRSVVRAYGIMAQIDGGDMTVASLEEVDDMPKDRLFSRFLLMLGSTRRLGAKKDSLNSAQIRITGVWKGADTLADLIARGQYHVLPTVDLHLGLEMGVLNADTMAGIITQLSPDEYIRQLLCINISASNLIWEKWIRRAMQTGLAADLQLADPLPGPQYKKRGLISFGYDAAGHGEGEHSSKHAFVVTEQIGNFTCFIFARTWAPGADDMVVKRDLLGYWRYFMPNYAMGDAYGVGMLTQLCDELYAEGLTTIDRRGFGEGQSTASAWYDWPFAPQRYEGMVKHNMAQCLRAIFNNKQAALPYIDDLDLNDPDTADLRLLLRQLANIRAMPTKTSYSSYKMVDSKIGDDLFDAAMASVWGLITRGAALAPPAILMRQQSREQLLMGKVT